MDIYGLNNEDWNLWLECAEEIGYQEGYSKEEIINRIDIISETHKEKIEQLFNLRKLSPKRSLFPVVVFVQNSFDYHWYEFKKYKSLISLECDLSKIHKFKSAFMYIPKLKKSVLMFGEIDINYDEIVKNCLESELN